MLLSCTTRWWCKFSFHRRGFRENFLPMQPFILPSILFHDEWHLEMRLFSSWNERAAPFLLPFSLSVKMCLCLSGQCVPPVRLMMPLVVFVWAWGWVKKAREKQVNTILCFLFLLKPMGLVIEGLQLTSPQLQSDLKKMSLTRDREANFLPLVKIIIVTA